MLNTEKKTVVASLSDSNISVQLIKNTGFTAVTVLIQYIVEQIQLPFEGTFTDFSISVTENHGLSYGWNVTIQYSKL